MLSPPHSTSSSTPSMASTPKPKARHRPYQPRTQKPYAIVSEATFVLAHRDAETRFRSYREHGRKGSVQVTPSEHASIQPGAAMYLNAANATARVDYVRIAAAEIIPVVGALAQSAPVALVTLCEKRFTVGLQRAARFDVGPLQAWARRRLPGCSFIGIVEAAYFTNVGVVVEGLDRAVSWHVHLLVWGISIRRLKALIQKVNRRYQTFVPGLAAGHSRPLDTAGVAAISYYIHKGVIGSYRVWPAKRGSIDPETGEVTREPTGRFLQAPDTIRPGDHARMIHVLADHTIDRLAFAAGEGVPLLARINRKALAPFHRWEHARSNPH